MYRGLLHTTSNHVSDRRRMMRYSRNHLVSPSICFYTGQCPAARPLGDSYKIYSSGLCCTHHLYLTGLIYPDRLRATSDQPSGCTNSTTNFGLCPGHMSSDSYCGDDAIARVCGGSTTEGGYWMNRTGCTGPEVPKRVAKPTAPHTCGIQVRTRSGG